MTVMHILGTELSGLLIEQQMPLPFLKIESASFFGCSVSLGRTGNSGRAGNTFHKTRISHRLTLEALGSSEPQIRYKTLCFYIVCTEEDYILMRNI